MKRAGFVSAVVLFLFVAAFAPAPVSAGGGGLAIDPKDLLGEWQVTMTGMALEAASIGAYAEKAFAMWTQSTCAEDGSGSCFLSGDLYSDKSRGKWVGYAYANLVISGPDNHCVHLTLVRYMTSWESQRVVQGTAIYYEGAQPLLAGGFLANDYAISNSEWSEENTVRWGTIFMKRIDP